MNSIFNRSDLIPKTLCQAQSPVSLNDINV